MGPKFKATQINGVGKCAVFEGSDDVFIDPFSDLSRVKFHSDFHYPSVTLTQTGTISLPSVGSNTSRYNTYRLFPHGVAGHPWVMGSIADYPNAGDNLALSGSVPFQGDQYGFARWLTLGADETDVLIHEQTVTHVNSGKSALTLDYTIEISDFTVENYNGDAPGGPAFHADPDRVILGNGKFDSQNRYIRAADMLTKDLMLVGGYTLKIGGDSIYDKLKFTYSNGDYEYRKSAVYSSGSDSAAGKVNFSAEGQPIKL